MYQFLLNSKQFPKLLMKFWASTFVSITLISTGCSVGGDSAVDSILGGTIGGTIGDSAFTASPSSYDFGNTSLNSTKSTTILLTNSSTATVYISSLSVNSPDYSVTSTACPIAPSSIGAGQSCPVVVAFTPTSPGLAGAALKVNYGISVQETTTYNSSFGLSGTGISPLIFAGIQSTSSITHNSVQLNWTANAQATSFIVFKMVAGAMVFEKVVVNASGTVANTTVSNLQPLTSYTWRVRGVDIFGNTDTNTTDVSMTTLANTNPSLNAIAAQTAYQGLSWSVNASNTVTNNDLDANGDALAYTCYYDTTVNGAVGTTLPCSNLVNEDGSSVTFVASTGVLTWTPPFTVAAGTQYEFQITAVDPYGGLDSKIFVTTVNGGAPSLAHTPSGDFTFPSAAISSTNALSVDFYNTRTGSDSGVTSYACVFDNVIDSAVGAGTACTSLPGTVSFNTTTGVLGWTPLATTSGAYEIKVSGTNTAGTGSEVILVNVRSGHRTTDLLAFWDADFVNQNSPAVNSPFSSSWKNLASTGATWDGVLTGFAGTTSSGWTSSGLTKLSFDGADDKGNFGTNITNESTVGFDLWLSPGDQSNSTIFSFGDSVGKGLTLRQSTEGDGKLTLTTGIKTYTEEILSDSPAVYYRLDEVEGSTPYDISGNLAHGTYNGTVTKLAIGTIGDGNKAVTLSPGSVNAPIAIGSTVTIEVWAATTSLGSTPMLWRTGPNGTGPDLFFSGGKISLNTWDSDANPFCASPATVTNGIYHHYVTVLNGSNSTAALYYDGVLCGTATYRNPSASSVTISSGLGSYEWSGSIDEIAVYPQALSAARILAHYNARDRATCRSKMWMASNSWKHIFGSFDNASKALKLYINGQSQCSQTQSAGISGSSSPLVVGNNSSDTSPWKGSISNLRAYSSADVATATTNFAAEFSRFPDSIPIASQRLWLDASSLTGVPTNTQIAFWPDQSVQSNHAKQATVASQPVYQTNIINGKPAIYYNGSRCLTTMNMDTLTNYTVFAVFQDDGIASAYERILDKDYVNGFFISRDNATAHSFTTGYKQTSAPYGIQTTFNDNVPHVLTTIKNGTDRKFYADGGSMVSDVVSSAGTSSSYYGIGCYHDANASQRFGGWIAEVLIYDTALSDSDRLRVERYLGTKYGITVP